MCARVCVCDPVCVWPLRESSIPFIMLEQFSQGTSRKRGLAWLQAESSSPCVCCAVSDMLEVSR